MTSRRVVHNGAKTMSITDLDVTELLAGYRAERVSPVEAVEAVFSAIASADQALHSVISVRREQAQAEAEESHKLWRSDNARPLEGVPIGLKDMIDVAGLPTTACSRSLATNVPSQDAEVVRRLRAAGAIVVAKLSTSPFAFADPFTEDFEATRNPWDLRRFTGGTSTGPAAALAARLLPLAMGTDSAGSVRIPAANCGVTGMKPTFGAISRAGVLPSTHSLDTVGIMARSARDIAMALFVGAGQDSRDPAARGHVSLDGGLAEGRTLRVGVLRDSFTFLCTSSSEASYEDALTVLRDLGCELKELRLPMADLVEPIAWPILASELASAHEALENTDVRYGATLKAFLQYGRTVPAADYLRCQSVRVLFQRELQTVLSDVDVLVSPTTQSVAHSIDTLTAPTKLGETPFFDVAAKNTVPFSVAGWPAISIPIASSDLGLPFGLQIVAPPRHDGLLLELAARFQEVTDFHTAAPRSRLAQVAPAHSKNTTLQA